jgi:uncharacterized protein YllA (UPF0747 family)
MRQAQVRLARQRGNRREQLENARLKQLVADLTLDKAMLQDVLAGIMEARRNTSFTSHKDRGDRAVRRLSDHTSVFMAGGEKPELQ